MRGRIAYIDTLRAASILYIVGFWHLMNYTKAFTGYHNPVTTCVTVIVLGLFVFLSGYLLAMGKTDLEKNGIGRFYLRRVLRIHPLFIASLALWTILRLENPLTMAKTALLITPIHGPQPPTLWFIACLLIYYLSAPLLIRASGKPIQFAICATLLFCALLLAATSTGKGDVRLAIYFPAFATGILACGRLEFLKKHQWLLLAGSLLVLACTLLAKKSPESQLWSIPLTCAAPLVILLAAERLPLADKVAPCLAPIAYASYAMYLLHRPIYSFTQRLYPPAHEPMQVLYLVFIGLPLVIALSWTVQKVYDKIFERLSTCGKRAETHPPCQKASN
jgi:peptidoglycan/LPS O-acetylase OafA/YrhL